MQKMASALKYPQVLFQQPMGKMAGLFFEISNRIRNGSLRSFMNRPSKPTCPCSVGPKHFDLATLLIIIIFNALVLPKTGLPANLELPLLWTVNLHTFLESAPTLADINNDGRDEILVAGREEMISLDKNGKELWRWRTRQRFMTYPAALPRSGQTCLIYAADTGKLFSCLNGSGKVVWQAELNGPSSWSAPVLDDLNSDGNMEVITTDESGTVWVFDAVTGSKIWNTPIVGMPSSPSVADLNGDGKDELAVITGEGLIYVLDHKGALIWKYEIGGTSPSWSTSSPIIFAASDGQLRVVAASNSGLIVCFDSKGSRIWSYPASSPVASTLSAGDIDQDGRADVFLITQTGRVYRFDESGTLLWDIDMQGRSLAAGAIIDFNNDGRLEYLLCTQQGNMLGFDDSGEIIYEYQFPCRTINVTPSFGDVTAGVNDLEMVVTGGESGKTFCFGTPAQKKSPRQWAAYRMNNHNTGTWNGLSQSQFIRMIPRNLFWNQINTGDDIRFSIVNPKPQREPLKASAACIRPDGSKEGAMTKVLGTTGELRMPLAVTIPGAYHLSWSLEDAKGQKLASGQKEIALIPFTNDRSLARAATTALAASADSVTDILPLSANALRREAAGLEATANLLAQNQNAVPAGDALATQKTIRETKALVKQARRALKISDIIRQAGQLGSATSLIAFEGPMWDNREVDEQLPETAANPLKVHRTVVPGEHEPISLKLFNVTDHMLQVRVVPEQCPKNLSLTPHYSIPIPTSQGEKAWDALPEFDEAAVISIPSLATREVWLDVETGNSLSGSQILHVTFQALDGAGVLDALTNPHSVAAPETRVEITLEVLAFTPASPAAFRLCTWSPNQGAEVNDLLAHGNNVFTVPHGATLFDDAARLIKVDFSRLDGILAGFKGYDVLVLHNGFPELKGDWGGALYRQNLQEYLNQLLSYMDKQGFDVHHFALYPIDEPGGIGWDYVNKLVEFGKMVHAINPNIMMYMDGGGELPMFKAMATVMDIWVPGIDMLAEDSPEMRVIRASGKMLWSYNCSYSYSRPVGANIKNINILAEFRNAALFALRHNTTGIGFWCYNAGGEDPWMRNQLEYKLVYPGRTKPVTSRRWEAVRESIEDYRILAALKECLGKTGQEKINSDTQKEIEHLLQVSLPELVDNGFTEMKLGLDRNVIDAGNNEFKLASFRNEMFDCIKSVLGEK